MHEILRLRRQDDDQRDRGEGRVDTASAAAAHASAHAKAHVTTTQNWTTRKKMGRSSSHFTLLNQRVGKQEGSESSSLLIM